VASLIANDDSDVVVIGGGPAGAFTALLAAQRGLRTTLFDRAEFPRDKVCGGTLNGAAMRALAAAGISEDDFDHSRLSTLKLRFRRRMTTLRLREHRVIARRDFDARLLALAKARGARVETGVAAAVVGDDGARVIVETRGRAGVGRIGARCVVVADGLGSRVLGDGIAARDARIGAGAVVADQGFELRPGVLEMAIGERGYVGLVRLPRGAVDVAAAFDAAFVRDIGSLGAACLEILDEAGVAAPRYLATARFHGTPALTRRAAEVARGRVFAVGDATGYVEPFTGEGMGWAFASALALEPLLDRAVGGEDVAVEYRAALAQAVAGRKRSCAALAWVLRRPHCVSLAFHALRAFPALGAAMVARFDRPVLAGSVR
jgi:menaquinone-9 beta-reductase